ncbi:hypothetical protein H5410_049441 [Solanum commersonii]|uniref:Uncharacterized protein n=1 Tax=Solanum commersonii TaxID=4109 RepID=A0A9J5WV37_SOLCO|nr:hypothetical protein H5410_049441 [Solanum commersonii]
MEYISLPTIFEIPIRGFSFKSSKVLHRAFCDSSKPGRSRNSERWVLHSTAEYAQDVIAQTGLQKPSSATLTKVAEELFQEFQSTKLSIPQAFFKKAHRCLRWQLCSHVGGLKYLDMYSFLLACCCTYVSCHIYVAIACEFVRGSAFPAISVAENEKCLWDAKKRLAVCGDFCVSPNVEGAIISGLAAAAKCSEVLCRL